MDFLKIFSPLSKQKCPSLPCDAGDWDMEWFSFGGTPDRACPYADWGSVTMALKRSPSTISSKLPP